MKRHAIITTLLFLLLAVAGAVKAQKSVEFAPLGAEWYYDYQDHFTKGYIKITVTGDTIIDGVLCRVLLKERIGYNYQYHQLFHTALGNEFLFQQNDSIMLFRNDCFQKLFDFEAAIGSSWQIPGHPGWCEDSYGTVFVVDKGNEYINGIELKYVSVLDGPQSYWGYSYSMYGQPSDTIKIIERIGPVGSYLFPEQKCFLDYTEGGRLRCYSDTQLGMWNNNESIGENCDYIDENHTLIMDNDQTDELLVFPNPSTGVVRIDLPIQNCFVKVFSSSGQLVYDTIASFPVVLDLSLYQKGIYYLVIVSDSDSYSKILIIH